MLVFGLSLSATVSLVVVNLLYKAPINSGLIRKKYDVQSLFGWNEGRDQSQEAPLMIELQSHSPPDFFPTPMRTRRGIPESAFGRVFMLNLF
jgi:hypothetical protein